MPDPRPIAVFDSGIGSLSVVSALRQELPQESIIYLADRARYPYGTKGRDQLRSIIIQTLKFLEGYGPKSIIVASITPSMLVLREARLHTTVPVFGVYPALSDAVALSKTKHIALMATKGMIESIELDKFTKPYITTARIVAINASPIIDTVESGRFLEDGGVRETIARTMKGAKSDPKIDVAILGSTHLPLVRDRIAELFPKMQFVNPALDTVKQVRTYLHQHDMEAEGKGSMKI
ncbi:MAG: glutamate racemase, partial [Nitrososphaerales archaeon]